jgi:polar amino acid transport system substrate-binding protein
VRVSSRRWWPLAAGALVLSAAALLWVRAHGVPGASRDETWTRIQREGVLRVAMDASYPPFDIEENGTFRGYDVDLAQEIGRRLGLKVTFVNVGFDSLYDALQAGRCDVIISALPYDRQRTTVAAFTGGYFNAGQVMVTRQDDTRVQREADLAGRRVAVEMGSQAHAEALRLRDLVGVALQIATARSSDEALEMVRAGRADAAIVDGIAARMALRAQAGLAIRGEPLTDESFVIAVRQGSPGLFAAVKGTLDALRGEGWLEKLAEQWL